MTNHEVTFEVSGTTKSAELANFFLDGDAARSLRDETFPAHILEVIQISVSLDKTNWAKAEDRADDIRTVMSIVLRIDGPDAGYDEEVPEDVLNHLVQQLKDPHTGDTFAKRGTWWQMSGEECDEDTASLAEYDEVDPNAALGM